MSASNNFKLSEEEVLLAFAIEPCHDRDTLMRYVKDYPEYSTALADLSIELMIEETREEKEVIPSTTAVSEAWQRFGNAVGIGKNKPVANPFSGLNAVQLKVVADKIGINKLLLVRLRDRGIDMATIPRRFVERAAIALGVTVESMKSYLSGPPCIVSDLSFRSDVKPIVTEQISFAKAVESSQLTAQQQAELNELMKD
jgi:hypothetical protein